MTEIQIWRNFHDSLPVFWVVLVRLIHNDSHRRGKVSRVLNIDEPAVDQDAARSFAYDQSMKLGISWNSSILWG